MKKRMGIIALIAILVVSFAVIKREQTDYSIAENEIQLQVQLSLNEDIGLLVRDYDVEGKMSGSGGCSNADKTLLKQDELLYDSIVNMDEKDKINGKVLVKLNYRVITEYVDPNYENIYPAEITKTLDEISFYAEFGKAYAITISGDKENGYVAAFNGQVLQ